MNIWQKKDLQLIEVKFIFYKVYPSIRFNICIQNGTLQMWPEIKNILGHVYTGTDPLWNGSVADPRRFSLAFTLDR